MSSISAAVHESEVASVGIERSCGASGASEASHRVVGAVHKVLTKGEDVQMSLMCSIAAVRRSDLTKGNTRRAHVSEVAGISGMKSKPSDGVVKTSAEVPVMVKKVRKPYCTVLLHFIKMSLLVALQGRTMCQLGHGHPID